jgi:serine/threonine protein kinase
MPATSAILQEGRYRLDHPIAESSESCVFQGYDTVRNTKVVVKEIVARMNKVTTVAQQENIKLKFANQAKTLVSLRHGSLIQVEDYFSEIGRQYLVLESIDGDDLESLIEKNKAPFALDEAVSWTEQILDALQYLHSFEPQLLHRNVRPGNVRRLFDGRVKLLAYSSPDSEMPVSTGIQAEEGETSSLNYSPLELIWDGLDAASQKVILGNYDDRSEKVLKSPADPRSDVYSVGATLYYLLTAQVPVDPLERSIEMLEGNHDPLDPPSSLNPSVPEEVSEVIMRAMEIKRENRFDSAVIMRQVLRTTANKVLELQREKDEDRELAEAAEALRLAEKAREEQARRLAEQKARELEDEKLRAAELQAQKEAQEVRLAAELKEEETRKKTAEPEDRSSQSALEEEPLELAGELETATSTDVDMVSLGEIIEESDEPFLTVETNSSTSKSVSDGASSSELESPFSYEETNSSSKLPMMIGAFVVLVLAGLGGWVFLGSGSPSQPPVPTQPTASSAAPSSSPEQAAATEPAPAAQSPVAEQPVSTEPPVSAEPSQSRTAGKPTPAKAAKPAEPAKTPEKKKVTVDDLINDN